MRSSVHTMVLKKETSGYYVVHAYAPEGTKKCVGQSEHESRWRQEALGRGTTPPPAKKIKKKLFDFSHVVHFRVFLHVSSA